MGLMILASSSPRRIELLSQITTDFVSFKPLIEEIIDSSHTPCMTATHLAYQKCLSILADHPTELIVGGDTIVVYENEILGKPKDDADALAMLMKLNGKKHQVITGLCVMNETKTVLKAVISEVTLKTVHQSVFQQYIEQCSPLDKAGSYGIQDDFFMKHCLMGYTGLFHNIMGFPVDELKEILERNFND